MLRRILPGLFIFVVLLGAALPTLAWDDTGHKITAYIAWQRMTPDVRERVLKILLVAPEDSTIGTYYMPYGSQNVDARKRDFFMFMATWADVVRDRNFDVRYKKYHKGNWHYDDQFWTSKDGKIEFLKAPDDGGQALTRITEFVKLIGGTAPDSEKAVAIAWLEHLIGDIHQPLHSSARVTDTEPKGDQGGNLFSLTPKDTPRDKQENLHWFWDSMVVRNIPNTKNVCDIDFLEPLANGFMKKYPFDRMQSRLALSDPASWAKESLTFAQNDVYSADLIRGEMPSDKYKKKGLKIAEERLTLAGYRMGEIFNQAFGAKATVASAEAIPCKIIRKVMYPITKTSSVKQTLEIALLDLCPTQVASRPMYSFFIGGEMVMKEYDVVRTFKSEAEARKYAADNNITDISF
ncbi:MAG: S1/P1 nuclease [Chloracidobacterium sp.]|nr:S1/P1 nuclease [Chloracidobacterium sp.]